MVETIPQHSHIHAHDSLNKVVSDPNFILEKSHTNVRGDYTLTFRNTVDNEYKVFANVNLNSLPNELQNIITTQNKEPIHSGHSHVALQSVLDDDNFVLDDFHTNVRGDYTLFFRNQVDDTRRTFSNVNINSLPEKLQRKVQGLPEVPVQTQQPIQSSYNRHMHVDEVFNNLNRFNLINGHLNVRGDYTLVFQEKDTDNKYTFANVKESHIPTELRSQLNII
ncbi:hypothetical protein ABK040_001491 [Willaertia magna]